MKNLFTLLSSLTLIFAVHVNANNAELEKSLKTKLANIGLNIKSISDTPVAGMKQVTSDRGVFYVSADGQHFFAGRLFELNGMKNLTEVALSSMRLEGLKEFNDSMIVYPAKEEKHRITVFTDTTCGYCQKLHREIADYNDLGITVQYLAFPRGGLRSQSFNTIQSVWCAKDPQQALTDAKAGEKVPSASCSAPISGHYNLGQATGVTGTPAIVFENGQMIPGYKPAAAIAQMLEAN